MRKLDLENGVSAVPVKILCSKSKHIDKCALSTMLPQLEQVKDKTMEGVVCKQASLHIPMIAPRNPDSLDTHYLRVLQALNYHPRVFRHARFSSGDLIA